MIFVNFCFDSLFCAGVLCFWITRVCLFMLFFMNLRDWNFYDWVPGLVHRVRVFLHGWSVLGQVNIDFHDWNMILLDPSLCKCTSRRITANSVSAYFPEFNCRPCAVSRIARLRSSIGIAGSGAALYPSSGEIAICSLLLNVLGGTKSCD